MHTATSVHTAYISVHTAYICSTPHTSNAHCIHQTHTVYIGAHCIHLLHTVYICCTLHTSNAHCILQCTLPINCPDVCIYWIGIAITSSFVEFFELIRSAQVEFPPSNSSLWAYIRHVVFSRYMKNKLQNGWKKQQGPVDWRVPVLSKPISHEKT